MVTLVLMKRGDVMWTTAVDSNRNEQDHSHDQLQRLEVQNGKGNEKNNDKHHADGGRSSEAVHDSAHQTCDVSPQTITSAHSHSTKAEEETAHLDGTNNKKRHICQDYTNKVHEHPTKRQKFIDLRGVPYKEPIVSTRKNGSSKYQGVCLDRGKWKARIAIDGKLHAIGLYDDEEKAAVDYARASFKYNNVETAKPAELKDGQEEVQSMHVEWKKKLIDLTGVPHKEPILTTRKNGTSKYQGVCFDKGKWKARITIDGKQHAIGLYDDEEKAAVDYARAAFKYKKVECKKKIIDLRGVPYKEPIVSTRTNEASKYQGVCFDKSKGKWSARIAIDGKIRCIGVYDDEEQAAVDYARAAFKYKNVASAKPTEFKVDQPQEQVPPEHVEWKKKLIDLTGVPHMEPILTKRKNGTSKYQGVFFDKSKGKWSARIGFDGKQHTIGVYDDEVKAAIDYARAAFKYNNARTIIVGNDRSRCCQCNQDLEVWV